jgi:anti-sigma regulatory factor (Ser/Thr protein kinase)
MERLARCGAHIHLRLPAEPESVVPAHQSVLGVASALDPAILADVRLLISELVTNAIRHGRLDPDDCIDLHVDIEDEEIRVEVQDPGRGFDPAAIPTLRSSNGDALPDWPPAESGWGLLLLRRIASRWGIERGDHTRVWFEMDLEPPSGLRRVGHFAAKGGG